MHGANQGPEMIAEIPAPMIPMFQSAIQRIIPHRYPFLLVDRVTEFVPGQRIAGIKTFTANGSESQGHAGGGPPVSAGILIEMVTQLGAILVLERPNMEGKIAVILQIPAARMLKPVLTGDVLLVEAEVVKFREKFGELRGAAYCQGERVAEGQMRFAVANKDDLLRQ
jgi:3-hydroxymyristoyl/3-hydroxydecanoyl-(acyl carrier protein) dehydratase